MYTIHKFSIPLQDEQTVDMPKGARILTAQLQLGILCLWAMVDTDAPEVPHKVSIYGTGGPVPAVTGKYVGTVQSGALVWHIFDDGEQRPH